MSGKTGAKGEKATLLPFRMRHEDRRGVSTEKDVKKGVTEESSVTSESSSGGL